MQMLTHTDADMQASNEKKNSRKRKQEDTADASSSAAANAPSAATAQQHVCLKYTITESLTSSKLTMINITANKSSMACVFSSFSHCFLLLLLLSYQQLLADIQSTVKKVQTKRKRASAAKQTPTAAAAELHVPQLTMTEPNVGGVRPSSQESVHVPHELVRGLFGSDVPSSSTLDPLFAPPKL